MLLLLSIHEDRASDLTSLASPIVDVDVSTRWSG